MRPITIVQGAQYGSEAKGMVALALAERLGPLDWAVRTGSINAGHTVVRDRPGGGVVRTAFQQLPVAAVLPGVGLVIGPGAYVSPETLTREEPLGAPGVRDRLVLDVNCGVHLATYAGEAELAGRSLKIGATGKGCAEAILHKIADRGVGTPLLLRNWVSPDHWLAAVRTTDTAELLTDAHRSGAWIMLEGTQGSLLDLHTGPYPFTTSRQTTAAAWVAEAGLSPALDYEVVLVARTYPIRVAGRSGPMGVEIDWPTLARRVNVRLLRHGLGPAVSEDALVAYEASLAAVPGLHRNLPDDRLALEASTLALAGMPADARADVLSFFETTTVTKRVRRLAELDRAQLALTVKKEAPAYLVLTFLNYVFPELAYTRRLSAEAIDWLAKLQRRLGCWVRYVTVGPRSSDLLETTLRP